MALTDIALDTEYRSAQADLGLTFYKWCLDQSIQYDRAVGYFSSTVFVIIGGAIVDFAKRGGRIRLICSPELTAADIDALERGHAQIGALASRRVEQELDRLIADDNYRDHVTILATLVALEVIDVKIAVRRDGHGIFHEKIGIFGDTKGNSVSFIGSANETWHAWDKRGNYEAIEVFCSWMSDAPRVSKHRNHFERIWEDRDAALTVLPFPEALRKRLCSIAAESLDDLPKDRTVAAREPPLRQHQKAAIARWEASGFRGVFKHATGSGKTVTALAAMKPHIHAGGVVILLVPSQLLLAQWQKEIAEFFGDANVLLAGAGNDDWRKPSVLRSFTSDDPLMGGRIVLATMQTARSAEFVGRVRGGAHLLLIADEVHQIGSAENSNALSILAGKRLGLSATPERYRDQGGTARVFDYFGEIVPPEYTLADAISDGHLVSYEYHPVVVSLTDLETQSWRSISEEISRLVARVNSGSAMAPQLSQKLDRLLIQRSRIAKNAERKTDECQAILRREYRRGQRWLVYCEGQAQLREVIAETRRWCSEVLEYHTGMEGDREATLKWFQDEGGILVAIACLDEGVNIPSISHAVILASSQNPRQFIQRRGRILRTHKTKRMAFIYDVLVSPEHVDDEPTQKSLLKSELRRALEFAKSATNPSAEAALRIIAVRAGINPDTLEDVADDSEGDDQPELGVAGGDVV
jgi:superfamily II DNA or RNA helicase